MKFFLFSSLFIFCLNSQASSSLFSTDSAEAKRNPAADSMWSPDNFMGSGTRTPVVTRTDMERMTPADRTAVRGELNAVDTRYNQFMTRHCTKQTGTEVLDESCGRVDIRNGDPNFKPELIPKAYKAALFANVPKNAKVEVHTKCHSNGKFYTQVKVNGKLWKNPYNNSTKWVTSPGQYWRADKPQEAQEWEKASYRTGLPVSRSSANRIRASGYITQWHIVSDAKTYAGAEMPYSVWLNNSGYAYHAGTNERPVDGYPASAGCFRLDQDNAKGLFNLTRRVGSNNMSFYWYGYKNDQGKLCTRPANAPNAIAGDITEENSRNARRGIGQRISDWWKRVTRTPPRPRDPSPEPVGR